MKNAVFWDLEPRRFCVDRRFGWTYLRWRRYIPPKRITQYLHGTTFQKTAFFNITLFPRGRIFNSVAWIITMRTGVMTYTSRSPLNVPRIFNLMERKSPVVNVISGLYIVVPTVRLKWNIVNSWWLINTARHYLLMISPGRCLGKGKVVPVLN
jgi:hypothetical protein